MAVFQGSNERSLQSLSAATVIILEPTSREIVTRSLPRILRVTVRYGYGLTRWAAAALSCTPRLRRELERAHMTRLKVALFVAAAGCSATAGVLYAQATRSAANAVTPDTYAASKEWPTYGHDSGGMRFSPLTQITPANVNTMEVAWVYHLKPEAWRHRLQAAAEGNTGFRAAEVTPLVINGSCISARPMAGSSRWTR